MAKERNKRHNGRDSKAGVLRDQALGEPDGLAGLAQKYMEWMEVTHYSDQTVRTRRTHLGHFVSWCEDRGLRKPAEITKPIRDELAKAPAPFSWFAKRPAETVLRAFRQVMSAFSAAGQGLAGR